MPREWDGSECPRPEFDDEGGAQIPGLGYRRWTFAQHEAHTVKLHEQHRPVSVARWPWWRATCSGCPGLPFGRCPYALWVRSSQSLLTELEVGSLLLTGRRYPADPGEAGRHIAHEVWLRGAVAETDLSVYCDGSIRDHDSIPLLMSAQQLARFVRLLLRLHHPIGFPLRLRRRFPWLVANDQRICHACANELSGMWRYRWCVTREWANGWRSAPAWLTACVGIACTQWPRPLHPAIHAHTEHCTATTDPTATGARSTAAPHNTHGNDQHADPATANTAEQR